MAIGLDSERYPRTCAWLAQLPKGLDSYPDCQLKADGRGKYRRDFVALLDDRSLPTGVRNFIDGTFDKRWIPEVLNGAVLAMARDAVLRSDHELQNWAYRDAADVYQKPINRAIMFVLSPTLLLMGTAKRWHHWHRGTQLTSTPVAKRGNRRVATLTLTYPPSLFERSALVHLSQVVAAAVDAAGGRETTVTVEKVAAQETRFSAVWV